MASSLPSFRSFNKPPFSRKQMRKHDHRVRYQNIFFCYDDEGKWGNNNSVDGNMSVLRERIEEMRKRDEKSAVMNGWNYKTVGYRNEDQNRIRCINFCETCFEVFWSISSAIGFVFFSGSLSILLVSFLVHFYYT